jgi:hypothetical protein
MIGVPFQPNFGFNHEDVFTDTEVCRKAIQGFAPPGQKLVVGAVEDDGCVSILYGAWCTLGFFLLEVVERWQGVRNHRRKLSSRLGIVHRKL